MTDTRENFPEHYTFSQRYGYEPLPEPMRPGSISDDLRREIWDDIYDFLRQNIRTYPEFTEYARNLFVTVFGKLRQKPKSQIICGVDDIHRSCERTIMVEDANRAIDFIEFMINEHNSDEFANRIKGLFKKHSAPYYLDTSKKPYRFFQSASREQGEATEQAIESLHKNQMIGATEHLREAAEHIKLRQYPDSIADSIHAVESVARVIDPKASKTLAPALKSLEKDGILKHPALIQAFKKLYGYTNDEEGIRHALIDKAAADVGLDEAIFMFGACASFAAYLAQKRRQAGAA